MSVPAGPSAVPVPALALVVLDGWGLAPPGPGNAISQAATPVFDELWGRFPRTTLSASGRDVGLPEGQMGNSEVGHLNLGAGAVVQQDLTRIDDAIADGRFFENPVLKAACQAAVSGPRGRLHLMGLVSDGGGHSGWEHIEACIDTVSGRFYAMDRDRRWERIKQAYDAVVHAQGRRADSPVAAVQQSYEEGETDEFIRPAVIGDYDGMADGDAVLHFNFRPDRARELVRALGEPDFDEFPRGAAPPLELTTLTEYQRDWPYPVAFPPQVPEVTLAQVVANEGANQLHVAETEKYAHVTYFFNGGREAEWEGEERCLVPSVRDVPTYDQRPEMSARAAADQFRERWAEDGFRFGIINFANPDMVGHTGDIPAAIRAVETVDTCLRDVIAAVHATGGACIVTADHGNADNMLEPDGSPNTAHSTNPVPLVLTVEGVSLAEGRLADVAPTCLELLGIEQPEAMTGGSLLR